MRTLNPVRHAEKRQEILDAAARCLARDGFQGASTAIICREAGISPGHLYHYFASKEEILTALTAAGLAIRPAQSTKNLLAGIMNASAVLIFVFSPQVHWPQAAVACAGAVLGGFAGARLVHRVNEKLLRGLVILIGVALTVGLFLRAS